ncbi:MAG: hypothetical protein J5762_01355 [Clostridia bacterium]|nr:hypothetical protein [Clostridia bacterium]
MKKKALLFLSILFALALALTACGKGGGSTTIDSKDMEDILEKIPCAVEVTGIEEGAELSLAPIEDDIKDMVLETVKDGYYIDDGATTYAVDISIVKDGEKVEPGTPVTVSIELKSAALPLDEYVIFHIHDGKATQIIPTVDGDKLTFTVEDFSVFIIAPKHHHTEELVVDTPATCTEDGVGHTVCKACGETVKESEVVPATGHAWGEWETVAAPTCVADGSKERTCTVCEETETAVIPAAGEHTPGEWIVDAAATCTAEGSRHQECTVCHSTIATETIPALGHIYGEWTVTKAATCNESGLKERECSACGAKETEVISATGEHTPGEWKEDVPATCEKEGVSHQECTVCHTIIATGTIPATGHTFGEWKTTKAATCTETGLKERTCSKCGGKETETIPALGNGHTSSDWIIDSEPTCTTPGKRYKKCLTCNEILEYEILPAAHTPGEWTVDTQPNCEEEGTKHAFCVKCGAKIVEAIPALGGEHVLTDWQILSEPTCGTTGYRYKYCTVCYKVVVHEDIPATGEHTYSDEWIVSIEPTCITKGSKYHECTVCHLWEFEDIPATGIHTPGEWRTSTYPTCTATGLEVRYCSVCYDVMEQREIAALGHIDENKDGKCDRCGITLGGGETPHEHSFGDWMPMNGSLPTCTESAMEMRVCSCGEIETRIVEALGHIDENKDGKCDRCGISLGGGETPHEHSFGEWYVVKAATCTEKGTLERKCECGFAEEQETEALGHIDENKDGKCDRCGITLGGGETPHEHTPSDWIIDSEPTCTTPGKRYKKCTACNEILEYEILPAAHIPGEWTEDVRPGCQEEGLKHSFCVKCGAKIVETIPALGGEHVLTDWQVISEPTCGTTGYRYKYCTICFKNVVNETIPETGEHTYSGEWVVYSEPTCSMSGTKYQECTVCHLWKIETIPATGEHVLGDWVVVNEPSCGIDGYRYRKCTVCGRIVEEENTPATGEHVPEDKWYIRVHPTCTDTGLEVRYCTVCYQVAESRELAAYGHNWTIWEMYAYSSGGGADGGIGGTGGTGSGSQPQQYQWSRMCTRCSLREFEDPITLEGRTAGDWEVEVPATCTTNGYKYRYSTDSDHVRMEAATIYYVGHTWGETVVVNAGSCTEGYYAYKTCTVCGEVYEEKGYPFGHSYGAPVTTVAPTCTETGVAVMTCAECGATETRTLPATGHKEGGWQVSVAATCTEGGTEILTCSVCGVTLDTRTTDPIGHDWDEWTVVTKPTALADGVSQRSCMRCGATETQALPEDDYVNNITIMGPYCYGGGEYLVADGTPKFDLDQVDVAMIYIDNVSDIDDDGNEINSSYRLLDKSEYKVVYFYYADDMYLFDSIDWNMPGEWEVSFVKTNDDITTIEDYWNVDFKFVASWFLRMHAPVNGFDNDVLTIGLSLKDSYDPDVYASSASYYFPTIEEDGGKDKGEEVKYQMLHGKVDGVAIENSTKKGLYDETFGYIFERGLRVVMPCYEMTLTYGEDAILHYVTLDWTYTLHSAYTLYIRNNDGSLTKLTGGNVHSVSMSDDTDKVYLKLLVVYTTYDEFITEAFNAQFKDEAEAKTYHDNFLYNGNDITTLASLVTIDFIDGSEFAVKAKDNWMLQHGADDVISDYSYNRSDGYLERTTRDVVVGECYEILHLSEYGTFAGIMEWHHDVDADDNPTGTITVTFHEDLPGYNTFKTIGDEVATYDADGNPVLTLAPMSKSETRKSVSRFTYYTYTVYYYFKAVTANGHTRVYRIAMDVASSEVINYIRGCYTASTGWTDAQIDVALDGCTHPEHHGYYEGLWEMFFERGGAYFDIPNNY